MKTTAVSEIADLPNEAIIYKLTGRLTNIYPAKRGKTKNGDDWAIQNLTLADSTGTIKIMVSGADDDVPTDFLNQEVDILAYDGKKGWCGVYAHDDDWKKKNKDPEAPVERIVKVTRAGTIALSGEVPRAAEETEKPKKTATKKASAPPDMDSVRSQLMKVVNAFYLIKKAVMKEVEQSEVDGIPTHPEQFQAECSTAFIHMDRLGLINLMPLTPLWSVKSKEEKNADGEYII